MLFEVTRALPWGWDCSVGTAVSGALGVPWDQRGAVTGTRTGSSKTSDMLPLTQGKQKWLREAETTFLEQRKVFFKRFPDYFDCLILQSEYCPGVISLDFIS